MAAHWPALVAALAWSPWALCQTDPPAATPPPERASSTNADTITLRGGWQPIVGTVLSVGLDGLVVEQHVPGEADRPPTTRTVRVDLADVLDVTGPAQARFAPFRSLASVLWRARTRMERGDVSSAETLFVQASDMLAQLPDPGPTRAHRQVALGMLRCSLARGSRVQALEAWLGMLDEPTQSAEPTPRLVLGDSDGDALDPATGLCPELAPLWLDTPALQAWAARHHDMSRLGPVGKAMHELYLRSARFEVGGQAQGQAASGEMQPIGEPAVSPGVELVRAIVLARTGDQSERGQAQRVQARDALRAMRDRTRANAVPAQALTDWQRAWIDAGMGLSLLRESDQTMRWRGVVWLLRLPAESPHANAHLTGLALAHAAVACAELGDIESAVRLRAELVATMPSHPARDWPPLRDLQPTPLAATMALPPTPAPR